MAVRDRLLIMLPGPTNVPDRVMRAMIKPIIVNGSKRMPIITANSAPENNIPAIKAAHRAR